MSYLVRALQLSHEVVIIPEPSRLDVLLGFFDGVQGLFVLGDVEGFSDLLQEVSHPHKQNSVVVRQ